MSPQILAAYAGTYEVPSGPAVVVTFEDGQLMIKLGPQPKQPVFAESQTGFFMKVVDAQWEFEKDASAVTLHQGPRDVKATRK